MNRVDINALLRAGRVGDIDTDPTLRPSTGAHYLQRVRSEHVERVQDRRPWLWGDNWPLWAAFALDESGALVSLTFTRESNRSEAARRLQRLVPTLQLRKR